MQYIFPSQYKDALNSLSSEKMAHYQRLSFQLDRRKQSCINELNDLIKQISIHAISAEQQEGKTEEKMKEVSTIQMEEMRQKILTSLKELLAQLNVNPLVNFRLLTHQVNQSRQHCLLLNYCPSLTYPLNYVIGVLSQSVLSKVDNLIDLNLMIKNRLNDQIAEKSLEEYRYEVMKKIRSGGPATSGEW